MILVDKMIRCVTAATRLQISAAAAKDQSG